ncbi:divalent-cation tolerance protein CutA [Patescibacteria group bacterium]|nr:divalent-cation tolerance protein CutA [Patescibacteria group bacterium]
MTSGTVACVNRINYVKSYYIQEEKFKQEEEKILLIKFPSENKEKLITYFKKNHPYKVYELIFVQPEDVNEAYLKWVKNVKPIKKK